MKVGVIRSDIGHFYLNDVENTSQRDFSSQPPGQSRYFHKPTTAELQTVLNTYAPLTISGSDTGATANTSGANAAKLNVRAAAGAVFTQVTVTVGAAVTKVQIVSDLNNAFVNAGLPFVASISGTNQVTINTTTLGQNAYIEVSASSPSTAALQTVLGITAAFTSPLSVASLVAAVYPTATKVNVAPATINALSTFSLLATTAQQALDVAVANAVAPGLVETGAVLLSFAYGDLSKLRSATYQPGGTRIGLPVGPAIYVLADDGVTQYVL
jgi:hypothetical protein